MFAGIHVDHAALEQGSVDLAAMAKRLDSRLTDLEAELAPLRHSWSGSAQQSYIEAQRAWDLAMADLVTLLADFSTAVGQANDAYRAADLRGARRFT